MYGYCHLFCWNDNKFVSVSFESDVRIKHIKASFSRGIRNYMPSFAMLNLHKSDCWTRPETITNCTELLITFHLQAKQVHKSRNPAMSHRSPNPCRRFGHCEWKPFVSSIWDPQSEQSSLRASDTSHAFGPSQSPHCKTIAIPDVPAAIPRNFTTGWTKRQSLVVYALFVCRL